VDFVLPPTEIARELGLIAKHPSMGSAVPARKAHTRDAKAAEPKSAQPPFAEESSLKKILRLLRNHGGVDFSLYKSGTLERRVMRRMVLGRINSFLII
jgi:two-component system CheB/CheR fusion protein